MRGKNLLRIALILMICTPLVFVGLILAQPRPIGQTVQNYPFESNPTAHAESGISVTSPTSAYDGRLVTTASFEYGEADGYFELSGFNNTPPTAFGISWVDIKISYMAEGGAFSDDRYRILCYVDPPKGATPDPIILQDWVGGEDAIYDPGTKRQGHRVWGNVTESNDGVWDWADIGSARIVVETDQIGLSDFRSIYIYEIWLTIYTGTPPPPGISVQPSPVLAVPAGQFFFVDVYFRNVTKMWGYQFILYFNSSVLRVIEYFSYSPFNVGGPSEVKPDYVALASSSYFGDQEGLTGSGPAARIYFQVLAEGATVLDLESVVLVNVYGDGVIVDVTDGLFANIYVRDVAVTHVEVSPTQVMPGENVTIDVTVWNKGNWNETFDVTVLYDTTPITPTSTQEVSVNSGKKTTLTFTWNTTEVAVKASPYQIKVEASTVPDETDTGDNVFPRVGLEDGKVLVGRHDIAITNVTRASPTNETIPETVVLNVTQGDLVYINVTMLNNGTFTEGFNVTAQYEAEGEEPIGIETKPVSSLAAGANTTLSFTWNTTEVEFDKSFSPKGYWVYDNYTLCTIKANATEVDYEKGSDYDYTGDNAFTDGIVNVTRSRKPEADFEIGHAGAYPIQGKTVTFTATKSFTPEHTAIVSYEWDFGDGTSDIYVKDINLTSVATHIYTAVGTFNVTLKVTNNETFSDTKTKTLTVQNLDIAIVSVTPSATEVTVGESLNITVAVENQGTFHWEDLNVTAYYDDTKIGTLTVINLANGTSTTLTFTWNTTDVSPGTYTIMANATPLFPETVTGEFDKADNTLIDGTVTIEEMKVHDIAVSGVSASPTEVAVGESVSISVTVENQGDFTETFTVAAFANDTQIGDAQTVTDLAPGANSTLTFTWDTTDVTLGTYTIDGVASTVSGETDIIDNTRSGDTVEVRARVVPTPGIPLYAVAGVAIVIAIAIVLIYFFKFRKPQKM